MLQKKKTSYKRLLIGVAILIVAFILFFLFIEIGIRIFSPQQLQTNPEIIRQSFRTTSDIVGWQLNPGVTQIMQSKYGEFVYTININTDGLRGPELKEKTDNVKRILVMGGSYTFGYGVSESASYPRLTEACLNKEAALRQTPKNYAYEVLNGGWAATNAFDAHYIYLRNNLDRLDPDIIVWTYAVTDYNIFFYPKYWAINDSFGLPIKIQARHKEKQLLDTVLSSFISIPRNRILLKVHYSMMKHSHLYTLWRKSIQNIIRDRRYQNEVYFSDTWSEGTQREWKHFEEIIVGTKNMLDERDIPLIFVIANPELQTIDKVWDEYMNKYKNQEVTFNRFRPQEELKKICKKHNIDCIDVYRDFVAHKEPQDLYFDIDNHWNEQGHEVMSNILCDELFKRDYVRG